MEKRARSNVNGGFDAGTAQPAGNEPLHREAALRLSAADQRYTSCRRALVEAMAAASRPLTIAEILTAANSVTISSAYRNLAILCEAEVARRLSLIHISEPTRPY